MEREPTVVIVQMMLPHYRVAFFELLRARLKDHGIALSLVHGQPIGADAARRHDSELPWASRIRNVSLGRGGKAPVWQPYLTHVRHADLVILQPQMKLLANHLLTMWQHVGGPPVAFWGHGKNLYVEAAIPIVEWARRATTRAPAWWFTYTEGGARTVQELGYPRERVTVVQNAIDTRELVRFAAETTKEELDRARGELKLRSNNVCVYCGGLYGRKRLPFLIEAALLIRKRISDFELIVVGAGPDENLVQAAAARHDWIKPVGPVFGKQKVRFFALAKAQLMPGALGLAVLDSFALGVPMVTTNWPGHGPEVEYLTHNVNGIIVEPTDDPAAYAEATASLLGDAARLAALADQCRLDASRYTNEEMATRFANGVVEALHSSRS